MIDGEMAQCQGLGIMPRQQILHEMLRSLALYERGASQTLIHT